MFFSTGCSNPQCVPEIEVLYQEHIGIKTSELLMTGSMLYPLGICAIYLIFSVIVARVVAKIFVRMSESAFSYLHDLYNIILSVSHVLLFMMLAYAFYVYDYNLKCQPLHLHIDRESFIGFLTWIYFIMKIAEMGDTFFRVIKPGKRMTSFLAMYHRMALVMFSWSAVKNTPGGSALNWMMLDCIQHGSILSYYYMFVENDASRRVNQHIVHNENGVNGVNNFSISFFVPFFLVQYFVGSIASSIMILRTNCGFSRHAANSILLYISTLFCFKFVEVMAIKNIEERYGFWNPPLHNP